MKLSLLLASPLALLALVGAAGVEAAKPSGISAGPLPINGVARKAAMDGSPENTQANGGQGFKSKKSGQAYVPRSYIVEFDESKSSSAAQKRKEPHAAFHEHMSKRAKSSYHTRYEFNDPRIFLGMSVTLDDDEDFHALFDGPDVKAVHKNVLHSTPAFDPVVVSEGFVRNSVGTTKVAGQKSKRAPASSWTPSGAEAGVKDVFTPHVMTGVDKLHAEGYFGKGQTVGIIDTGIDYTHPALGGKPGGKPCFGKGCKVSGGYDLVGDAYTGYNNPIPDSDPFADCPGSGHGTHVAGTVAANDTFLGFTGVAPHANIKSYRVFGCGVSSASDDVIIAALEKGFFDGVDILSLSLGGPGGWQEAASASVASRIAQLGTPVVMANGNDGSFGTFYASSPGSGFPGTAVGSVQNLELTGYRANVVPSTYEKQYVTYLVGQVFQFNGSSTLEVYATSTDPEVKDDACQPLPDSTPDLSNKVVVVGRGTCPFQTKFANVAAKGAKYVLVYNTPAPAAITYVSSNVPGQQAASLTREDGQFLVRHFAAGDKISLDFSNQLAYTQADTATGGLMSDFSTYGPSYELQLAPQVSAPGGNILSTWPVALGSYTVISGTSMATPFVSGSYAVYRAAHGGKTSPNTLRTIFGSTGSPIKQSKSASSLLETVTKQGGGLINVYDAFYSDVSYSPSAVLLNDTEHFKATQEITVRNHGKKSRTYKILHEPAGTAQSLQDDSQVLFNTYPVPLTPNYATPALSKSVLVVPPGGSAKFSVSFVPPAGLNGKKLPLYSGYLHLSPVLKSSGKSDKFSSLRIPYLGVNGALSKQQVLDDTDELFGFNLPALLTPDQKTVITDDEHTYSLADNNTQPAIIYRLAFGTPFYQIDLVHANTTFKPTIPIVDSNGTYVSPGRRDTTMVKRSKREETLSSQVTPSHHKGGKGKGHGKVPPSHASKPKDGFSDVKTVGTVYRESWLGRNSQTGLAADYSYLTQVVGDTVVLPGNGQLEVPEGKYRLLLRAQKVFTKGDKESDYESYLTHVFTVKK
ncbi:subtilisin-like protein [Violaceomyces palustris]|uniref:Subtilisin-like protein n=1 Tax=Violaceomyces palustris TaxID=1673888 RepID=A0ACD0P3F9_9BASI|nr:subtilisin-like protein [Violaceomyces palustris]